LGDEFVDGFHGAARMERLMWGGSSAA